MIRPSDLLPAAAVGQGSAIRASSRPERPSRGQITGLWHSERVDAAQGPVQQAAANHRGNRASQAGKETQARTQA